MTAEYTSIYYNMENGAVTKKTTAAVVKQEASLAKQVEANVVGIYPDFSYQTMEGFGCAMTESACYLLSRMEPEIRTEALKCWFDEAGMDARFIRIPLDSCDYSLTEYQAVENPLEDLQLASFSIARTKQYILPVVKEAIALADHEISALLSPWSPPAEWKTAPEITENDAAAYGLLGQVIRADKPSRCFGGRLKKEYYGSWAKYLVKYVQAFLEEGIPVTMLSVQNEASAATIWDSCIWSGEEESIFLRDYLYPEFVKAGLTDRVGLYIWDHNKERMVEHIQEMMKYDIADMVQGFAYHWYTGDHFEALSMIHERYPDKILMHSESCPLHIPGQALAFPVTKELLKQYPEMKAAADIPPVIMDYRDAVNYAHDIIGDINHGMNRWIDWNLCVDRTGGPRHVPGGFSSPILAEDDGSFTRTVSFEYLLLISHIIKPGSVRLGSTVWSDDVEAAAVRRPDHSMGVLLLNNKDQNRNVALRFDGMLCELPVPANTLTGVIFDPAK